jgi:hypothetical protein
MTPAMPGNAGGVPRWVVLAGSAFLLFHLGAVGVNALAAPSGPWPTPEGPNMSTPPLFAFLIHESVTLPYLRTLKMTHNAHFTSNRPGPSAVAFTVRLEDADGNELKTLRIPDPNAAPWLKHRQELLARALADDLNVPPPQGETIPAPGHEVPMVSLWEPVENRKLILRKVPEHLVPRDRPVMKPSDWSLLLARSYARHLCREHGAARAELVRLTRDPVSPAVLFLPANSPPPGPVEDLVCNFGRMPR